jgi:hypothetical protein
MKNNKSKQSVGLQVAKIVKRTDAKRPLKYFDVTGQYGVTTAGQAIDFSPIPQGVGNNQRTGDEISVSHIEFKDTLFCGDATNIMRVILVRSKGNSIQMLTNLLSNGHAGSFEVNSIYTPYYEKRFRILSNKQYAMCLNGMNSTITDSYVVPVNQPIAYQPGATTYVDGQIVLYLLSDSAIVTNPSIDFCARIWFRDI